MAKAHQTPTKENRLKLQEIQLALLKTNHLILVGKVNIDMLEYVQLSIAELTSRDSPPITVDITSSGGDVTAGLDIYDMFVTYPSEVTGVVRAYARSMAVIILQGCSVRQATKHSRILIHHISRTDVTLDTLRSEKMIKETLKDMEHSQEFLYEILSKRTRKSVGAIRKKCKEDVDMLAHKALDFGLLDTILPERPPRK